MTFLRPISYAPHPVIFGGDHGVSVSGHSANPRGSFWGAVKNTLEMPGTWRMSEHPEKSPEVCVKGSLGVEQGNCTRCGIMGCAQ